MPCGPNWRGREGTSGIAEKAGRVVDRSRGTRPTPGSQTISAGRGPRAGSGTRAHGKAKRTDGERSGDGGGDTTVQDCTLPVKIVRWPRSRRGRSTRTTEVLAFHDIHPQGPVQSSCLVPKRPHTRLSTKRCPATRRAGATSCRLPESSPPHRGRPDGFPHKSYTGRIGRQDSSPARHVVGGPTPLGHMLRAAEPHSHV